MEASWALVLHCVAAAVIGLLTIGSTVQTILRIVSKPKKVEEGALYEDKDGTATRESQDAYSIKLQNVLATLITVAGFGVALAGAVRATVEGKSGSWVDEWVQLGLWILLLLQRIQVLRERSPTQVYNLTLAEAISFLTIALLNLIIDYLISAGYVSKLTTPFFIAEIVLALCGFVTCINFPRRPDLTFEGNPVDGAYTASAFAGFTYSWPAALLAKCRKAKDIEYVDVPCLDSNNRTKQLVDNFRRLQGRGSMLKLILHAHWPAFALEHLYTALDGCFMVAPQFVMYNLLRLLEARDAGANIDAAAKFWVIALGLVIVVGGFLNNMMWWYCYFLNVSVRAQLGGIIFDKSTRRKDIKGVVGSKETAVDVDPEAGVEQGDLKAPLPEKGGKDDAEAAEDVIKKTRQGVVNLIGVDAKRVADFAALGNMFLGATCRLTLSFVLLGKLLGWQPLCAGLAVQIAILPVNIYFSRKYTQTANLLMTQRDRILAVVNECLGGIRQIKFAALEEQWQKKIMGVREDQLKAQWKCFVYDCVLISVWLTGPVLLSATTISVYAIIHGGLPPSVAFTTISILGQIEGTLAWLPELTTNMLDAYVSLNRIGEYLAGPEKETITEPGDQITFDDAMIAWPSDEKDAQDIFTLRNVNLAFPIDELSVISGRTGSGKSLLLAAILGEVELLAGKITAPQAPNLEERRDDKANKGNWILPSAVAYVSQQPWLENASFKDNILFGLPLDEERYRAVVTVCALDKDLAILTDGESTEIGTNGINLSGGQKWRVTLARAIYSRAGILVLDDIFSAVDAHVGKHIFEQALTGDICKGRTRILVTHHVSLCLPATKYEVHLGDGTVEHAGLVSEMDRNGVLESIIDDEDEAIDDDINAADRIAALQKIPSNTGSKRRRSSVANGTSNGKKRGMSHSSAKSDIIDEARHAGDVKVAPKKFVEDEKKETGWVKLSIYKAYLDACGGVPFWLVVAIGFGGYEALLLGRSWILRLWTENYESKVHLMQDWYSASNFFNVQGSATRIAPAHLDANLKFYLALYFGFAVALVLEGTVRYIFVFYGSIKASRALFENITHTVLRAPLRWLDITPTGRILNRFSTDFNAVDGQQAYFFAFALYNLMLVVGVVVAGTIVSPIIIVCALVLLIICSQYALYYITTARQLKRLESTAKSPIFELFSTALAGVSTLRAFDKQTTYIKNMYARLDTHARMLYHVFLMYRWLGWRLNCIGAFFSFLVAALIISMKGMDAALSGFALGFTLQYTEAVTWLLRNFAALEMSMNSMERIIEYTELKTEVEGGDEVPASWPTEGRMEVKDLVVAYAEDLKPVLRGLTFDVKKNERVGVVGRTGAGKSSLTLALFRFLEAREGSVHIDGIDISKIKLHDLRSRLAIIPQDPVLFSGTIRSNLDPFDEHTDQELRDALERVHLLSSAPTSGIATPAIPTTEASSSSSQTADASKAKDVPKNTNVFNSLTSAISEGGLNLSQGQRQLLCLARAIVSRPKIMILDEATSAVDKSTDALIQRSIREEFQDATLIVIAHRLSTIADFDRILVMDEGKVAEYDSPKKLVGIEDGVFKGMVESSGESGVLMGVIREDAE